MIEVDPRVLDSGVHYAEVGITMHLHLSHIN